MWSVDRNLCVVQLKCSALSTSITGAAGTAGDALAECWRPALCHEALELAVSWVCFLTRWATLFPIPGFEKKSEGLRGRCTQTTKMEMKQWQMMMCHILKEFCQGTCCVFKVNCGFSVMRDRSCMFFLFILVYSLCVQSFLIRQFSAMCDEFESTEEQNTREWFWVLSDVFSDAELGRSAGKISLTS